MRSSPSPHRRTPTITALRPSCRPTSPTARATTSRRPTGASRTHRSNATWERSPGSTAEPSPLLESGAMPGFRPVDPKQSFPELEQRVLERWREDDVFARQLEQRREAGAPIWSFYEGPPTANGKPGSHHVLSRVFKDVYPRFQAMRGHYVPRKAGWDCHGLPVELEVEKELGISSKAEIEEFGIAEFNARCRESVFRYVSDWNALTERIGFWIDLDDPYVTLDNDYIESVWWSLRQICRRRPPLRGPQGRPLLPALRHRALLARGRVRLRGRGRSLGLRAPAGDRGAALRRDPRAPGAPRRLARRLDDHSLDADLPRRRRRRSGHRVRPRARRRTRCRSSPRALAERVLGEEVEILSHLPGAALEGIRYEAPFDYIQGSDFGPLGHCVAARRLRHHRGRHGPRAHRARLRRGRLPPRREVRDDAAEPGQARRPLRRARPRLPGQARLRPQPRDRRGARGQGAAAARRGLRARLPALLALRHRASLLREVELVHPHDRGPRPHAGREREDRLAPRARQARALRQVARGQRRLGALARALLGNAAAGLGVRVGRLRRRASAPARSPTCASAAARFPTTCTGPTSTRSCSIATTAAARCGGCPR